MRTHRLVTIVGCILAALVTAAATVFPPIDAVAESGKLIVEKIRESFFDAELAKAWADKHATLGQGVSSDRWPAVARAALAELHASHTDYVAGDDPRNVPLRAIFRNENIEHDTIGLDAIELDHRWFVTRVLAGSSAQATGVARGDEIVACDGAPFQPVRSLAGKSAVRVMLRHADGEAPEERTIPVRRVGVREEWLTAQTAGTRSEQVGDARIGIVPILSGGGDEYRDALDEAITTTLRNCEGLVIDFRDGFGGCSPSWARLFAGDVPVLEAESRKGSRKLDTQWRGPLVILINKGTRSGKEMIARSLQRSGRAVIVGERSAGAVLGGTVIELPDQALLYLAVEDVRIDGERLEGVGVKPDVEVADRITFAGGRDPQLERAIEIAAELARKTRITAPRSTLPSP